MISSGKSTFTNKLCELSNRYVRLENDPFVVYVRQQYPNLFDESHKEKRGFNDPNIRIAYQKFISGYAHGL